MIVHAHAPRDGLRTQDTAALYTGAWYRMSQAAVCSEAFEQRGVEATTGFEPVMGVLQTPALPLGYVAL